MIEASLCEFGSEVVPLSVRRGRSYGSFRPPGSNPEFHPSSRGKTNSSKLASKEDFLHHQVRYGGSPRKLIKGLVKFQDDLSSGSFFLSPTQETWRKIYLKGNFY